MHIHTRYSQNNKCMKIKRVFFQVSFCFQAWYKCEMCMEVLTMVTAGWGPPRADPAGAIQVEKKHQPWRRRAGPSVEARLCSRTRTSPQRTRPCSVTDPRPLPGCGRRSPGYAHRSDAVPAARGKCPGAFLVCQVLMGYLLLIRCWGISGLLSGSIHHLSQVDLLRERKDHRWFGITQNSERVPTGSKSLFSIWHTTDLCMKILNKHTFLCI